MDIPRTWLLHWATAVAMEVVTPLVARQFAHCALCAGLYSESLAELDQADRFTQEGVRAPFFRCLGELGAPPLTKHIVHRIAAAAHVRSHSEEPAYNIAFSLPQLIVDYDHGNELWGLKCLGEDVADGYRDAMWRSTPPDTQEFRIMEADVERRVDELRSWRSELSESEEAYVVEQARLFDRYECGCINILWFDPRQSQS